MGVKYWGKGKYIGKEFPNEYGSDIEIGNDEVNGVYNILFDDGSEFDNIYEEEIFFFNKKDYQTKQ